jgi:flagellar basal body-associated protein FliL
MNDNQKNNKKISMILLLVLITVSTAGILGTIYFVTNDMRTKSADNNNAKYLKISKEFEIWNNFTTNKERINLIVNKTALTDKIDNKLRVKESWLKLPENERITRPVLDPDTIKKLEEEKIMMQEIKERFSKIDCNQVKKDSIEDCNKIKNNLDKSDKKYDDLIEKMKNY